MGGRYKGVSQDCRSVRGALGSAWARASYLHVPRTRLPAALADLHRALALGAPAHLTMRAGEADGELADDDFPGRFFASWRPDALCDVLVGAGFAVTECAHDPDEPSCVHLRGRRSQTLADTI